MTPAEHAELSAQVARAIGWRYVYPHSPETDAAWFRCDKDYIAVSEGPGPRGTMLRWRKFDYRAPSVALPLLEWLMRKHGAQADSGETYFWVEIRKKYFSGVTLPEAIARAVIAVADAKRQQVEQNEAREVLQA